MSESKDQYLSSVWDKVLEYIQINCNLETSILTAFYRPCYIYDLTEEKATIAVTNTVAKQIITQNLSDLEIAFCAVLQSTTRIEVELVPETELKERQIKNVEQIVSVPLKLDPSPIQSSCTFDNFIIGDCNRESQAAALACAVQPGKFFNPLFIYGNSGLGKTHLLMAIANFVKKNNPEMKVFYTESLKFVEMVVNSIRDNKINEFKQYMYNIDVLLIDDIQMLAGKEKSHEIFFTIYNELVNNHKQVCIASDRLPNEIPGIEERMISRFSSGLSVGIDSPEFETSLAILKLKIKQSVISGADIDDEGLSYIASNFSGNVRKLEGALNRVLFYSIQFQPDGGVIRFETVLNALKSQAVINDKTGLSPKKIIKTVADFYGLTHQQITGKTRTKNIANARHISIYLCRKLLDLSYIKIGEEFGGRDHSTIICACSKIEKQIKKDPAMAEAIKELESQLNA